MPEAPKTANAIVRLTVPQNWRLFSGFGFGLREPAIVGVIRILRSEPIDFAGLDDWMARFITEKPPENDAGASDSTRLAARVMFWAGAVQRQANIPVFGRAYMDGPHLEADGDLFRVAVPIYRRDPAINALSWAAHEANRLLAGIPEGRAGEAGQDQPDIIATLDRYKPSGINTYRILLAAHTLGIPAQHMMEGIFSLGTGVRTRWLQSSFTDQTSLLGSRLAVNKMHTAQILHRAGLPGGNHARATSSEEAVRIARRLGYPVVVKPADRQQGTGVAAHLDNDKAVIDAYANAAKVSDMILVEKHFEGDDFRLTVVNGKLFAATARLPGGVTGDGEHTIPQLVELENLDPVRQRRARERGGAKLAFDDEAKALLGEAGRTADWIPPKDQFVKLRRRANISAGGSGRRMNLGEIHPDNIRLAERAARAVRLDLAGVDLLVPDIGTSWLQSGALICEVNAQPQIGFLSTQPLIEHLFSAGSRVPMVVLVGPSAAFDWQRIKDAFASARVGYASAEGIWHGADQIAPAQKDGLVAGLILLGDADTEAAIVHMLPGEISRLGLPGDACDGLVIAAPDGWSEEDRKRLGSILTLAMPHAATTIYTAPAEATAAAFAGTGAVAGDGAALEDICAGLVGAALAADRARRGE